ADAAKLGADLRLGWRMTALEAPRDANSPWRVTAESNGTARTFDAEHVWSTIPISVLARTLQGGVAREVTDAARTIRYRAMILIYVQLPVEQFTEYDAHYFPGATTRITRLSEPKNYSALGKPKGSTVLCAELPCNVDDDVWRRSEHELGQLVADDLRNA